MFLRTHTFFISQYHFICFGIFSVKNTNFFFLSKNHFIALSVSLMKQFSAFFYVSVISRKTLVHKQLALKFKQKFYVNKKPKICQKDKFWQLFFKTQISNRATPKFDQTSVQLVACTMYMRSRRKLCQFELKVFWTLRETEYFWKQILIKSRFFCKKQFNLELKCCFNKLSAKNYWLLFFLPESDLIFS